MFPKSVIELKISNEFLSTLIDVKEIYLSELLNENALVQIVNSSENIVNKLSDSQLQKHALLIKLTDEGIVICLSDLH